MITLLAAADLHLGRRTRLPVPEADRRILSAETTWKRITELAVAHKADALLIAGDCIDAENAYLETFGPFEAGLTFLAEHRIPAVMVAGNHDWTVLKEFTARLKPEVRSLVKLLGSDGRWEEITITRDRDAVDIVGWSFPAEHVRTSPLKDAAVAWKRSNPVIGLLHADFTSSHSPYAPVRTEEFVDTADFWLLGHIHKPGRISDGPPELWYAGSPHSFSAKEPGAHGPLLIRISSKDAVTAEQLPLSPIRFETMRIDCSSRTPLTVSGLQSLIAEQIRDFSQACAAELQHTEVIGLTVELIGQAVFAFDPGDTAMWENITADSDGSGSISFDGRSFSILSLENRTSPAAEDLHQLAHTKGPDGELARIILSLRSLGSAESGPPPPEIRELLAECREAADQLAGHGPYAPIKSSLPFTEANDLLATLENQALHLLSLLTRQKTLQEEQR
jgi:DNA repair protein SbcD/Mre11